jgi:hypothetical protein
MFLPRYKASKIKFWDRLDSKIYFNALRNNPKINVTSNRVGPYCVVVDKDINYVSLPKDPVKWELGLTKSNIKKSDLVKVKGAFRRNSLEHEMAELKVGIDKCMFTEKGRSMQRHKFLYAKCGVHHSVHPLIAEFNASGRSITAMRVTESEWSKRPSQSKIVPLLKQFGWTPARGLPVYGSTTSKIQKRVEVFFGELYKKLIDTKVTYLERKYKGIVLRNKLQQLLEDAAENAGGRGLKRKYLK